MSGVNSIQCIYFRSYDRSSRSLDQESPSKKKKFQTNYASTTHLLAGKKVPSSLQTKSSDVETTVFYIPGVDVKVKAVYNWARKHLSLSLCRNLISNPLVQYMQFHRYRVTHQSLFSSVGTAKIEIMTPVILHSKLMISPHFLREGIKIKARLYHHK